MRLKNPKALKALALFLVFALTQVYVNATFAGPAVVKKSEATASTLPQATGKLVTRGNQSVLVNGTSASTGASILTGATIETGDGVGATINLGPLGSIDLAPNTKVELQYTDNGIKLKLLVGCAILKNKKGTRAEVSTEQGPATSDDGSKGGAPLDVCFPQGAPNPIVNQGAAANAGAGAGGGLAGAGGGAGGGSGGIFGLGTAGTVALLLGVGAAIIIPIVITRGDNPSPATP
ncbi:MAG TPA: hypothetical protein VF528_01750 [Pyrinomonadaceae bacterium]|jgi:hypothetical protein